MDRRQKRKIRQRVRTILLIIEVVVLIVLIGFIVSLGIRIVKNIQKHYEVDIKIESEFESELGKEGSEKKDSEEPQLDLKNYPEVLIHAYEINPEMEEFVLNYLSKKESYSREILDEYLCQTEVPLFLQWDSRWGYYAYGSSIMGVTGCGPTCLSMVALHLLQDAKLTPIYMADYAKENGYYAEGVGTEWRFMTEGARALGLKVQEVSLTERIVKRHLEQGRPIICAMREGDFTETGHFIVLVGVEDGKIRVNDPNSRLRSERLWDYDELEYQIKSMWAYSVKEN